MYEIRQTEAFRKWLMSLNKTERGYILDRLDRVEEGNFGDHRNLTGGVSELRFKQRGPGHRIYFTRVGKQIILLLAGGDKSTQKKDITLAREMVKELG